MAAGSFTREEVLRMVLEDENVDSETGSDNQEELGEEKDDVHSRMDKFEKLIDSFDGGDGFNGDLFRENAKKALMPILCQSLESIHLTGNKKKDCQEASSLLNSRTINVGSLLLNESMLWLNGIHRRLGGKVGIRRPYFGEITRNVPYDIFLAMRQYLRDIKAVQPECYMSGNKKGDAISLTSYELVESVLTGLSGKSVKEVRAYLKRRLTASCRFNHQVKVIVSNLPIKILA